MKINKILILTVILAFGFFTSCKDDSLQGVPEWESAVHGFGQFAAGSAQNFVFGDPTTDIDFTLQWVSIDGRAKVNKMEIYVLFNEPFTDPDGNPSTAKHGGDKGKLLATYDGTAVPANRTPISFSVTQAALYNLYSTATFDYDKNPVTPPTPVFNNPAKPERDASNRFVKGDSFQVRWEFTTEDGRKFSAWGISVCTEFPGANCSVNWGVICESDLAGSYSVVTNWTECGGSSGGGTYTQNIVATSVAGKYTIPDLSGGMEPEFWSNPPVACTIVDECNTIKLDGASFSYIYGYFIKPGSNVNPVTGVITIIWENAYGEFGTNVYTPN